MRMFYVTTDLFYTKDEAEKAKKLLEKNVIPSHVKSKEVKV